jgi:hypothetical protein
MITVETITEMGVEYIKREWWIWVNPSVIYLIYGTMYPHPAQLKSKTKDVRK